MKNNYKSLVLIIIFVLVLGISINVSADADLSCTGVFGPHIIPALDKYIYVPVKWATPILLLVLTSVDFAKVVFDGKKEDMDKAKNNFLKRAITAVVIFFIPDIIKLLVEFIDNHYIAECLNSNFK